MTSYFLIGLYCTAIASPVIATYCQVAVSPPDYLSACLYAFLRIEIHFTFSLLLDSVSSANDVLSAHLQTWRCP